MPRIDESREKRAVRIAIVVVTTSRDASTDRSGKLLRELAEADGHQVRCVELVKDDRVAIRGLVTRLVDDPGVEVVIATGGTGLTGSDVTPEAFGDVYEKEIPGFGELFRWLSFKTIGTSTIQSRATAGVARGTYLFALPGSPGACRDAWEGILRHQLDSRLRPCNLVEMMPRLRE